MTAVLKVADVAALSPLLILLASALVLLLLEAFNPQRAKKGSFYIAIFSLLLALIATVMAPSSENPLFTPWLRFDPFARFFSLLFLAIGCASACLAASFFERVQATHGEYYFLLLSAVAGLLLMGAAADFLTLFLGIETLSMALYVLCAYMKKEKSSGEGAIKYFFMGALATAFLLYGIALLYGAIGTTSFEGMREAQGALSSSRQTLFWAGLAFIIVGLAFKGAIVPFHGWAPDVYEAAPNPVTAFMAVGVKGGAFAAFARLFFLILPPFHPVWNPLLTLLAILTMIYASFVALRQVQLRRLFAYSGMAHAGFLLIPVIVGGSEAWLSLEFYLVVYALATLGAFAILALFDKRNDGVFLNDLQGLFHRSPFLASLFTLFLLTLAGMPPTAGFFAKFYLFKIAFQGGDHLLVIVALLTTLLSLFYSMRIVSILFSETSAEGTPPTLSWPAMWVGSLSFAAILIVSLYPNALLSLL